VFVVGQFVAVQMRVRQRVAAQGSGIEAAPGLAAGFDALVSGFFNEKRFGLEGSVRAKLRRELVRAGFFRADAINYYIFFGWLPSSSSPSWPIWWWPIS
jgi:tight adherence protein C